MSKIANIARTYCRKGWAPVPVKYRGKSPIDTAWQNLRISEETVEQNFNGDALNVGVLLGEASGGLVDIDIDNLDALKLADYLLPRTGAIFGRNSNPRSHRLYVCDPVPVKTQKFNDENGKVILEVRSSGGQTVFPGSVHESGERIEWANEGDPAAAKLDDLLHAVQKVAAATIVLGKYGEGNRQDVVGALAGSLARAGYKVAEARDFVLAITEAASDSEYKSRLKYVDTTYDKVERGENVYGLGELARLIGADAATKIAKYLNIKVQKNFKPEPLVVVSVDETLYPVDALGELLGPAAAVLHAKVKAPLATCGQSLLTAASMMTQPYYDISPPHGGKVPLSINALTINESGDRKSAVDKIVMRPIRQLEESLAEDYQDQLNSYRNEEEAYAAAKKDAIAKVKREKGSRADIKKALDELGAPPVPPKHPFLLAEDPTIEGLYRSFKEGHPAQGCFTDEGGILVGGHAMNGDNLLKTVARLSKLWDGAPFDRARGGDERGKLYGRRLALHWMMQPVVALELFNKKIIEGQGFFPRCLLAVPRTLAGTRLYIAGKVEDAPEIRAYSKRAIELLQVDRWPVDAEDPQKLCPYNLRLTPEAAELYARFHDNYEVQLAPGGELEHVRPFASKIAEHALRITGVLAVFDGIFEVDDQGNGLVDAAILRRGIVLAEYSLAEWVRLKEMSNVSVDVEHARLLLQWLHGQGLQEVHGSQILQYGPYPVRNRDDRDRAIRVLELHGWMVPIDGGKEIDGAFRKFAWEVINENV